MDETARRTLSADMARLADGDRSAFDSVFAALHPALLRFARRVLEHDADAEDAAQAALLRVFYRAAEYDHRRDGLSWALGITAWECRTVRRRRTRRREDPLDEESLLSSSSATEAAVAEREVLRAVQAALSDLSARDVEAILAAAGFCDRPEVQPATFRKRLERALTRFRQRFGASS